MKKNNNLFYMFMAFGLLALVIVYQKRSFDRKRAIDDYTPISKELIERYKYAPPPLRDMSKSHHSVPTHFSPTPKPALAPQKNS